MPWIDNTDLLLAATSRRPYASLRDVHALLSRLASSYRYISEFLELYLVRKGTLGRLAFRLENASEYRGNARPEIRTFHKPFVHRPHYSPQARHYHRKEIQR